MNIMFADCGSWAKKYNVGDEFPPEFGGTSYRITDIEHKKFEIREDNIDVRYENGNWYTSWCISCQDVFLIIDKDSGKVLFTSKGYTPDEREDTSIPFYKELRKLIDNNFKIDDGLYDVVDEFDDI